MNPRQRWKRDGQAVQACLKEMPDGRLVTTKGCKIYIPTRYAGRGLASIGIETHIVGIYAIVVEDQYYAVCNVNAMQRIAPSSSVKVVFDDEEYYEFTFDPGSTVISSLQLVKTDTLVFKIYDEIISKGRVPWYLGYADLGRIFDTAKYHAGANIGQNHEVTELLISMIARDRTDRRIYYRQSVKSLKDAQANPPVFIPLRSTAYGATNTTSKLAGSYFKDGLTSALVSPADRVEPIEEILRR
ncbi:hypothetical protein D3C71_78420 [compost metagenome]